MLLTWSYLKSKVVGLHDIEVCEHLGQQLATQHRTLKNNQVNVIISSPLILKRWKLQKQSVSFDSRLITGGVSSKIKWLESTKGHKRGLVLPVDQIGGRLLRVLPPISFVLPTCHQASTLSLFVILLPPHQPSSALQSFEAWMRFPNKLGKCMLPCNICLIFIKEELVYWVVFSTAGALLVTTV